jgi:hypothetical protein
MAAPQVAGVISIMLGYNPCLSVSDVIAILASTRQIGPHCPTFPGLMGPLKTRQFGYGLVDAERAVLRSLSNNQDSY